MLHPGRANVSKVLLVFYDLYFLFILAFFPLLVLYLICALYKGGVEGKIGKDV